MENVKVYGADWCPMTKSTLSHLDSRGVEYEYIDIDQDGQAAAWVRENNGGKEKKPMVEIGSTILNTPTEAELDAALR